MFVINYFLRPLWSSGLKSAYIICGPAFNSQVRRFIKCIFFSFLIKTMLPRIPLLPDTLYDRLATYHIVGLRNFGQSWVHWVYLCQFLRESMGGRYFFFVFNVKIPKYYNTM